MLYYTIFLLFRFWLIQFPAVTMLDKKQEKWRGTEEQRTEKNIIIGLFSYLFCWFWAFSCLFTAAKKIKQIIINGCEIAIEYLKIDMILILCFTFFSLSFFHFFSFSWLLFFLLDLFAIDCGFSRSTSVSTILFHPFWINFSFYFNKWLLFFSREVIFVLKTRVLLRFAPVIYETCSFFVHLK